ncbi:MAG: hypothetical protein NC926_11455 [Candidatus Omnitrophica bacterium]|nr:hypothetical protein [Candidatus Omnitrophota bacterium]
MKYNAQQVYQVYLRERNDIWIRANKLLNQDFPNSLDNYNNLERLYEQREKIMNILRILYVLYKKSVESKVIILKGENEKGEKYYKIIHYIHRFTKQYLKRLWRKFKKYMEPFENSREALFLTLTIAFREFNSIGAGARWAQKQFNSLMTVLRRYGLLYYVAIKEIQEKNTKNIHYHVLILNEINVNGHIRKIFDIKELEEIIRKNWKFFFKIEKVKAELKENGRPNKKSMRGYLGKYLKKSLFKSENEMDSDTMIILWALNMRVISRSRRKPEERVSSEKLDLITQYKTNSNSLSDSIVWEYLGVFSYFQVPLQEGIYREDDIHPSILDVIYKFLNNKSKLKKIF